MSTMSSIGPSSCDFLGRTEFELETRQLSAIVLSSTVKLIKPAGEDLLLHEGAGSDCFLVS
jgi:hypothetical protein